MANLFCPRCGYELTEQMTQLARYKFCPSCKLVAVKDFLVQRKPAVSRNSKDSQKKE